VCVCVVDDSAASWGEWSEWGECFANTECGRGQRVRHRLCPSHVHRCHGDGPAVDYTGCNATCTRNRCFLFNDLFPYALCNEILFDTSSR